MLARFQFPTIISLIALALAGAAAFPTQAADGRDEAARAHIRAIENSHRSSLDEALARFDARHFSLDFEDRNDVDQRRTLVQALQAAARDAGDVLVDEVDGEIVISLEGLERHVVRLRLEERSPWRIDGLAIEVGGHAGPPPLPLTRENLAAELRRLATEAGLAGVVYLRLDGQEIHHAAYGLANPALAVPMRTDTIFGVGSRPIDFTIAAILLLDQRGALDVDDPLHRHLDGVPRDKRSITLRHLFSGQSGLPDFHGRPTDWDQDLAWIDREEAVRRILGQPLRFAPGDGTAHSHSAYGLLAAVIERVSGQPYLQFLDDNFFEPAGMTRTGEYGQARNLAVTDFAVGGGPSRVGVPNIPPNWGPTSWLVKGSGGMYSTLADLLAFYALVRSDAVLDEEHARHFRGASVHLDGSDRGFELFSAYDEGGSDEAFLFVNLPMADPLYRRLWPALEALVMNDDNAGD